MVISYSRRRHKESRRFSWHKTPSPGTIIKADCRLTIAQQQGSSKNDASSESQLSMQYFQHHRHSLSCCEDLELVYPPQWGGLHCCCVLLLCRDPQESTKSATVVLPWLLLRRTAHHAVWRSKTSFRTTTSASLLVLLCYMRLVRS